MGVIVVPGGTRTRIVECMMVEGKKFCEASNMAPGDFYGQLALVLGLLIFWIGGFLVTMFRDDPPWVCVLALTFPFWAGFLFALIKWITST